MAVGDGAVGDGAAGDGTGAACGSAGTEGAGARGAAATAAGGAGRAGRSAGLAGATGAAKAKGDGTAACGLSGAGEASGGEGSGTGVGRGRTVGARAAGSASTAAGGGTGGGTARKAGWRVSGCGDGATASAGGASGSGAGDVTGWFAWPSAKASAPTTDTVITPPPEPSMLPAPAPPPPDDQATSANSGDRCNASATIRGHRQRRSRSGAPAIRHPALRLRCCEPVDRAMRRTPLAQPAGSRRRVWTVGARPESGATGGAGDPSPAHPVRRSHNQARRQVSWLAGRCRYRAFPTAGAVSGLDGDPALRSQLRGQPGLWPTANAGRTLVPSSPAPPVDRPCGTVASG